MLEKNENQTLAKINEIFEKNVNLSIDFNDVKVDNLVAMDYHVQHLIYESGYAKENKCWFADWNILPSEFGMDYTREGWTKIIENPKLGL